jgi:tetratricopeptide (TPR) repeat protein
VKYKNILAAFLLIWTCKSATAQEAAVGLYNEANQLYRGGEFAKARDKYLQSIDGGLVEAHCYYNLGNACFKVDRLGEAILWYERALKLAPRDQDVQANLRFANAVKKDRDPALQGNVIWRFLEDLYYYPTPNELSLVFSFLLAAVFALATWRLWHPTPSFTVWLSVLLICCAATATTGLFLGVRVQQLDSRDWAIVTAAEGTARSEPDGDKTALFVIHEGTKVEIERQEGKWFLVRLSNGFGGWLPRQTLTQI